VYVCLFCVVEINTRARVSAAVQGRYNKVEFNSNSNSVGRVRKRLIQRLNNFKTFATQSQLSIDTVRGAFEFIYGTSLAGGR